jgi:glycosyltransferase involved in cell wall biosynthesis
VVSEAGIAVKARICVVTVNVPFAEWFLLNQLEATGREFDLSVYLNAIGDGDRQFLGRRGIDAKVIPVAIERKIHPVRDLRALLHLWRAMRRERYALVHSTTPKAGLLAMFAAWLARVPVRIHTFTGQVWFTSSGLGRFVLKTADRFTAFFATHILVDSPSQRRFIVAEGVVSAEKSAVLAHGSLSGVDVAKFAPDKQVRARMRAEAGIPDDAIVILYMARLTRDKGALNMANAFARLDRLRPGKAHLMIVGPDEEQLLPSIKAICRDCLERVHFYDRTSVPEDFMVASDILCLPSFREGFGTVLINAAAAGIPAVAARIYGSEDAVVDGETGLLHVVGDPDDVADKLRMLIDDPALRTRLGQRGLERVAREFSEERITSELLAMYRACIQNASRKIGA